MRLLLVDGMNLLFAMFYGMPSRIVNQSGKAVQGAVGFVGALLKMIRLVAPTHVAVLFDGERENPRIFLDADYKSNRPDYGAMPEEETPFCQLPMIDAALDALGIAHAETEACEADDWIAGYALTAEGETVIASLDSDFFQLVSQNVRVLRYRGSHSVFWTEDTVRQAFGIAPNQYADFKSLVGDSADAIRGVDGIGKKTAATLLDRFGSIDGILTHAEEITSARIRRAVLENEARLRKNQSLIRLGADTPLPFAVEEMQYRDAGKTSTAVLREIGVFP